MPIELLVSPMDLARIKRNSLIQACEWMRFRHMDELALGLSPTLIPNQYTQLLMYIQTLRICINPSMTDPTKIVWPTAPSFIKEV